MRHVALVLLLAFLPLGCSVLGPQSDTATPPAMPVLPAGMAYGMRIQFTDEAGDATADSSGLASEAGDAIWPLAAVFGPSSARWPIVGMFFAKKGAGALGKGTGNGADSAYGVQNNAITSKRVRLIEFFPMKALDAMPALPVMPAPPAPKPIVLPAMLTAPK